jgi:hypothetical protein
MYRPIIRPGLSGAALVLVLIGFLLCCASPTNTPDSAVASRIQAELGLRLPYTLKWISTYNDGGSTGVIVAGGGWHSVSFVRDIPMRLGNENAGLPYLVYMGTSSPSSHGGVPLEVGSRAESAFVDLLRILVDQTIPGSDEHGGAGATPRASLTKEQKKARLALYLLHSLERQRNVFGAGGSHTDRQETTRDDK